MKATLEDFAQSNYLGAIPMSFDTIITGLIAFYNHSEIAIRVAYAFFWISTAMTFLVSMGSVFITFSRQTGHDLENITGVWLLSFGPMVVTSTAGSSLLAYLDYPDSMTVLVFSFLMWSIGVVTSFMVLTLYLWRLMAHNLPPRDAIVSSFIPLGPLSQGSLSIQQQAVFISQYLKTSKFTPTESGPSPLPPNELNAVAEMVHLMGIIIGLFLVSHATFWLVEACSCVLFRIPKKFNIGFWGFVFPLGAYANSVLYASHDIQSEGLKGWAATCAVATLLLWLLCAMGTIYCVFWKGELLYAPGLEGWISEKPGNEQPRSVPDIHPELPMIRLRRPYEGHVDDHKAPTRPIRDSGTIPISYLGSIHEEPRDMDGNRGLQVSAGG